MIEQTGNRLSFIAAGQVKTDAALPLAERLKTLHEGMTKVLTLYQPDQAAIEETFMNTNAASSLKLGHARGALMLSVSIQNIPLTEYATRLVKKSVVGVGKAEKHQVEAMVKMILPSAKATSADAFDALAVAICHAHHR
jgi:crossover junction endodeoxyribonuclease RuvC